jgi:hypothetical protein
LFVHNCFELQSPLEAQAAPPHAPREQDPLLGQVVVLVHDTGWTLGSAHVPLRHLLSQSQSVSQVEPFDCGQ